MWKSIKIEEEIKVKLDQKKVHPRQSYGEVIKKLLEAEKNG